MSKSLQALLFEKIKTYVPEHSVLELEIAKVLGCKAEDIFSMLRGQGELSLNDAQKLVQHYAISLDHLQEAKPSVIPFRFRAIDYNLVSLEDYFKALLNELKAVDVFGPRKLTYAANDFPIFSLFQFPLLAAFKLYFWGRTVYNLPSFQSEPFDIKNINTTNLKLGERAWRQYLKMPSVEVWSSDIVNNVLKQIFHAWKYNFFKDKKDALAICDKITALLKHIEKQAELGRKFHPKNYPPKRENFQLYYNEVSISNNTILFATEDLSIAFVLQNTLNYLVTDHRIFCLQTDAWLKNLVQKSTLISLQNEDLRKNFFEKLNQNIEFVKAEIDG